MKQSPTLMAALLIFGAAPPCFGDSFHYKDVLVGERASGMGGAYTAISDDPSGMYHNPAGIIFGLENYLSVSANAYATGNQTYENIYPGQNYEYRSASLIPVLFGFTQSYGKDKFGFAVIVPNFDLIDQNDTVTRPADPTTGQTPLEFTRRFFRQDISYLVGPSYAVEISDKLAVGISAFGLARSVKLIDNTLIKYNPIGTGDYFIYNATLSRSTLGAYVKGGVQYMPMPKLSVGFTAATTFNFTGSGSARVVSTQVDGNGDPVTPTGAFNNDLEEQNIASVFSELPEVMEYSLGVAYFVSPELLLSAQVDMFGSKGNFPEYPIRTVFNWSIGTEYYVDEGVAIRLGLYTNNTNARRVDTGGTNQPAFVNLLCLSTGISLYREGTSLTLGLAYSHGVGKGQAFGDLPLTQTVNQSAASISLAGSYQL